MVFMKCTNVFRGLFCVGVGVGEEKGILWENFSMEESIMREGNFHEGSIEISGSIEKKTIRK